MPKPTWLIYLNNFIAFIIFKAISIFYKRTKSPSQNLIFINTGQLGDVIISSLIIENEHLFPDDQKIFMVFRYEYSGVFSLSSSKIKVIPWNYKKYKWNIFYRIYFLNLLKRTNAKECYNLTSARGITCDELALLSGANKIFAINSDWLYLKKAFGKWMDKKYSSILCSGIINEYEKHFFILKKITGSSEVSFNSNNKKIFSEVNNSVKESYIAIAPFSSISKRAYPLKYYLQIIDEVSSFIPVVILGKPEEGKLLNQLSENNNIKNLCGRVELSSIPGIIKDAELFIGNDSGLTHLALRTGKKVIGIIGGGCYGKYFPYKEGKDVKYFYHELSCFGCEWNCIYDELYCLTNINSQKIIDEIRNHLQLFNKAV